MADLGGEVWAALEVRRRDRRVERTEGGEDLDGAQHQGADELGDQFGHDAPRRTQSRSAASLVASMEI